MREIRSSGSVEGVMSNHDPYSDQGRKSSAVMLEPPRVRRGSQGCGVHGSFY
jgi:hypothetical protein